MCQGPLEPEKFDNLLASGNVYSEEPGGPSMSLLDKFFGSKAAEPRKRVRVCIECGMPVEEHKDWCAIRRGAEELAARSAPVGANGSQA